MSLSKLREIGKDEEAWRAAVHGVTKSQTQLERLNDKEMDRGEERVQDLKDFFQDRITGRMAVPFTQMEKSEEAS